MTYSDEELLSILESLKYDKKYYKMGSWKPYPWQKEFMDKGKKYRQRYLRAGNQTGKTKSQGIEVSQHITGKYQPWYEGERIEGSGHLFWCIGVDLDATANVMMYELFGVKDIRHLEEIGTGSLPKDCIEVESMVKDGRKLVSCRIKHEDGGYNILQFYGAQQGAGKLMGSRVKYAWIDEIPLHNSMDIYTQCIARTINTKGWVTITGTPEQGLLPIDTLFEESNELLLQQVSWSMCPHITEETAERLLKAFPEYQHQMRRDGLPVIGTGAVFEHKDSDISSDAYTPIDNEDQILWSLDIGKTNDPTVITLAVEKENSEGLKQYFIAQQWVSEDDRSPVWVNSIISTHLYSGGVIITPHDAGGTEGYAAILRRLGLNVHSEPFRNPTFTTSNIVKPTSCRSIEVGLYFMDQYFKEQKLKVSKQCNEWFTEKAGYYRTGKTGGNAFAGSDHSIDSSRYAFMSLLGNKGISAGSSQGTIVDKWGSYEPMEGILS